MNPTITILAEDKAREKELEQGLRQIDGLGKVSRAGQDRGVPGMPLEWVGEVAGNGLNVVNSLINLASNSRANIRIKVAGVEMEVTNANRKQILEILEMARKMAADARGL